MDNTLIWVTCITSASGFLSTIATLGYQFWKRERQRTWYVEDLERVKSELISHSQAGHAATREQLTAVSDKADLAYQEANGVNAKIAALARRD